MRTYTPAAAAFLGCLAVASACSSERVVPATEVVVSVNSELRVGDELTRVHADLIDPEGTEVFRPFDFALSPRAKGTRVELPFAFTVTAGERKRLRVHLTGYGPRDAAGKEPAIIEAKAIAEFRERETLLLKLELARSCYQPEKPCGSDRTCYPESKGGVSAGSCGEIPVHTRLPELPEGGETAIWEPASKAESDAGSGDDASVPDPGSECGGEHEAEDCPRMKGEPCERTSQCDDGLFCAQGVCCNERCDDGCTACNLAGKRGMCTATVDFETDPDHCSACGEMCKYGYCSGAECVYQDVVAAPAQESADLLPGFIYAMEFIGEPGGVLRSLGALVDPEMPGDKMRVGLYDEGTQAVPQDLLAWTGELSALSPGTGIDRQIRVEELLDPPVQLDFGFYWIAIAVSQPTRIWAGPGDATIYTAEAPFGPLPDSMPATTENLSGPWLATLAVTTPQ